MSDLGRSLGKFFRIGIIAALFILLLKWGTSKVSVPGLSTAVQAI